MATKTISTTDAEEGNDWQLKPSDAIASSPRVDSTAMWTDCIDSLLRARNSEPQSLEFLPSCDAIDAALSYLVDFRQHFPTDTPAWIRQDPEGGVILEWQDTKDGVTSVDTVCFFNDGIVEWVSYTNNVATNLETSRWKSDQT